MRHDHRYRRSDRFVFAARAVSDGVVVAGTNTDVDELIGRVAADAHMNRTGGACTGSTPPVHC